MQKISFKQFLEYQHVVVNDLPCPDTLDEGLLDAIKAKLQKSAKLSDAEIAKLFKVAKEGDTAAHRTLKDYAAQLEKKGEQTGAIKKILASLQDHEDHKENEFQRSRAGAEAEDQGSSRRSRAEAGSANKRAEPTWNPKTKQWERGANAWAHVGKHG
jgi:uncharacterized protein (DUF885 family)